MLKEGDRIPAFRVMDQDGNTVTQKDFEGKRIVLYFYPKDSTPGCTAEACNLRDNYGALRAAGYFGAWGEKKLYGKVSMGTLRKTFIIAADGTIERIIDKVDTKNHTEQILP